MQQKRKLSSDQTMRLFFTNENWCHLVLVPHSFLIFPSSILLLKNSFNSSRKTFFSSLFFFIFCTINFTGEWWSLNMLIKKLWGFLSPFLDADEGWNNKKNDVEEEEKEVFEKKGWGAIIRDKKSGRNNKKMGKRYHGRMRNERRRKRKQDEERFEVPLKEKMLEISYVLDLMKNDGNSWDVDQEEHEKGKGSRSERLPLTRWKKEEMLVYG